jgi:nucleotide-binding universal stress UspA family protein
MGRIVVGIDGSEPSKAALAWALEEAGLRSATLEVVCAYSLPSGWLGTGGAMGTTVALPVTESDVATYAEETLETALAEAEAQAEAGDDGGKAPVEVVRRTVSGHAAQALVKASEDADLLVVGSRGHGDFGSILLGSVGLHCVHHAYCPVVVVRGSHPGG